MQTMSEDIWRVRWENNGRIITTPPTFINGIRAEFAGREFTLQQTIVYDIIMALNIRKGAKTDE